MDRQMFEHRGGQANSTDRANDAVGARPDTPYTDVQVKNTFIQVGEPSPKVVRRRHCHQRCVSEPLCLDGTSPLPQTVPESDAADRNRNASKSHIRQAEDVSTTASSPKDRSREDSLVTHPRHRNHCRQLSTQTIDSFDMDIGSYDPSLEQNQDFAGSVALEDADDRALPVSHVAADPSPVFVGRPHAEAPRLHRQDRCNAAYCDTRTATADHQSHIISEASRIGAAPASSSNSCTIDRRWSFADVVQPQVWAQQRHFQDSASGKIPQPNIQNELPARLQPSHVSAIHTTAGCTRPGVNMPMMSDRPAFLSTSPAWQQQAANPMFVALQGGLKPEIDTEAVASAAYARGVAAGVAQAAFEKGFAAGAAAAAGRAATQSNASPQLGQGGADAGWQGGKRASFTGKVTLSLLEHTREPQTLQTHCKWFRQGTCKFGAECRYLHDEQRRASVAASIGLHVDAHDGHLMSVEQEATCVLEGAHDEPLSIGEDQARECGYHVVWCDQRAFKDSGSALKAQLESAAQMPIKCYRTADMCMRLLRKKEHVRAKQLTRIYLVSMTNARSLVPFLSERPGAADRVVVLCDTCGSKGSTKIVNWALQYPVVEMVATTWSQALDALRRCI